MSSDNSIRPDHKIIFDMVEPGSRVLDLGCGTGTGGAAWALELNGSPKITGVDLNQWVLEEGRWNYRELAVRGETRKADLLSFSLLATGGILLAFTANELDERTREKLLPRLIQRGMTLVVEPIAHRISPWWHPWAEIFESKGGRADEWRFSPALPDRLTLLDKAAGLDHRELKCRSLWLPPV